MAALHADTCDLGHPGSPSATVAILREQPEAVDCLVLGDTTILLEEPTGLRIVTDDRLENVAAVQHSAMHQHATGTADHDRSFAELVTEQRRHRNHPDGFWVASTDPSAAQHALTDTVPHGGLERAAVLSDGATRLVDRFGLLDWPSFLDVLAEQGQTRSSSRSERPRTATRTDDAGRGQAPSRRLRRLLPSDLAPGCAWDELQQLSWWEPRSPATPRVEGSGRTVLACPTPSRKRPTNQLGS